MTFPIDPVLLMVQPKEEVLDLLSIQDHLISNILKKTEFLEFSKLEETCARLKGQCKKLHPRCLKLESLQISQRGYLIVTPEHDHFSVNPSDHISCRLIPDAVILDVTLTNSKCEEIVNFIATFNISCDSLIMNSYYLPDALAKIIQVLNVKRLVMNVMTMSQLCIFESFRNLETVVLQEHDLTDSNLFRLSASSMVLDCCLVTLSAVNSILMSWINGSRLLHSLKIRSTPFIPYQQTDLIFASLNCTVVWTPDAHKDSQFAHVPLSDLPCIQRLEPIFVYSIFRSSDIFDSRLILLSNNFIEILSDVDELTVLKMYGFPFE